MTMKMAKPSQADYKAFDALHTIMESLVESRVLPEEIENESPRQIDDHNELITTIGERVHEWWEKHGHCWHRVVFGGQVAIENACDPNAATLEFKPAIAEGLRIIATLNAAEKRAST